MKNAALVSVAAAPPKCIAYMHMPVSPLVDVGGGGRSAVGVSGCGGGGGGGGDEGPLGCAGGGSGRED